MAPPPAAPLNCLLPIDVMTVDTSGAPPFINGPLPLGIGKDVNYLITKPSNYAFQITVTDRAELSVSKKWGALHVINNLFKIYFELNNLRLCQNLIRAVEGQGFPKALECQVISGRHFPIAQLVTYHYFVGRLSLLNSQFARAEKQLAFAFNRCPATAHSLTIFSPSLMYLRLSISHFIGNSTW